MSATPDWPLAARLADVPLSFGAALRLAADRGFRHVDLPARADRPAEDLEALADAGVLVLAAGLEQPRDAADLEARRATLKQLQEQVADAARLGARCAYLRGWTDAEGCALLADYAGRRMVRLAVAGAADRLAWLEEVGHANFGLLLDEEACVRAGVDALALVRRAGRRLFHLHLSGDVARKVEGLRSALGEVGYQGGLAVAM
jgi:sugar phosphate isomerase/epimerase